MLTGIGLRNFKAFGDEMQEAPLSKITLIYGPNSGGKSSIIQALLLLRQSLRSRFSHLVPTGVGTYIDLVSFHSLIHKHDEVRKLGVAVKYRNTELGYSSAENEVRMRFDNDTGTGTGTGLLHEVSYKIAQNGSVLLDARLIPVVPPFQRRLTSGLTVMGIRSERQRINTPAVFLPFIELNEFNDERRNILRSLETTETREAKAQVQALNQAQTSRVQDPENTLTQQELQELNLSTEQILALTPENIPHDYQRHLRLLNYLGPLRSAPERFYKYLPYDAASSGITGIKGDFSANVLYRNAGVKGAVNDWFARFQIPYELDLERWGKASLTGEYITITLYDSNTKTEVTIADVGYGINQILPVIIEGIASEEGSIICVEQPEIHLHPRLQASIADLMIDTIEEDDGKRKQWIVETHSELLILRLQRRIREGKIKPDDISVLYVDPNDESTEGSAIIPLRMDENGDFVDEWPDGFFDESFNELMAEPERQLHPAD